jgi:hypothetical protein
MPVIFSFDVINTQIISGVFRTKSASDAITVDWGDGSATQNFAGTSNQAYSKDYGTAGNRTVTISAADESVLTRFIMNQTGANITFDLADLPSGLAYFTCYGSNTVTGNLADLPVGVANFECGGSNTVTGNLSSLPIGLTYFICRGANTISQYSGKTWTTKPATFDLRSIYPGGLPSADIDQLINDLNDDLAWAAENVITLTGSNAPPTSESSAAIANIRSEGATVTVSTTIPRVSLCKITATQANFFGTGKVVGDYITAGTQTLSTNNKVQQVLEPSTSGVKIVSSESGTTQKWTNIESGFAFNEASYSVRVDKKRPV